MATATLDSLVEDARGRLIEWRRHLHRNPEVSFHEEQTARFVRETLESFGELETAIRRAWRCSLPVAGRPPPPTPRRAPACRPSGGRCPAAGGPSGLTAVSSSNSRIAATIGSSPSSARPFGPVQAPRSRPLQNGPPGWARKTSSSPPERRNRSSPALTFERFAIRARVEEAAAPCTASHAMLPARPGVVPFPPDGQDIGGSSIRLLAGLRL